MKLEKMKKEDLEVLSYTDLTEMILKENKKAMKTADIFRKICNLLELSEDEYANKIGDFYTSMTTDKRFVLLSTSEWDLKDNHKIEINLDEEDDDDEEYVIEEVEEENNEDDVDEDNSVDITDDEVDLNDDDDMEDLTIVTDDELDDQE